jgi:hypothetical protein
MTLLRIVIPFELLVLLRVWTQNQRLLPQDTLKNAESSEALTPAYLGDPGLVSRNNVQSLLT